METLSVRLMGRFELLGTQTAQVTVAAKMSVADTDSATSTEPKYAVTMVMPWKFVGLCPASFLPSVA